MKKYIIVIVMLIALSISGCTDKKAENTRIREASPIEFDIATLNSIPNNPEASLSVPTDIKKYGDTYFIVDCYHNRVIYNDNLTDPIYEWFVMTEDIKMGHTIASDGEVYLLDDTENNRILVMEESKNAAGLKAFIPTQEFTDMGTRPHFIVYDEATAAFYAWSSMTGEMFVIRRDADSHHMYLSDIRTIPELDGFYVRSFTIDGNDIYFVSGNGNIIVADLESFEIKQRYPVPADICGMIQVLKIQDYFYITISTDVSGDQDAATIIRTHDLAGLISGDYEDIYSNFIGGGTPYTISKIDGKYYLCEHRLPGHSIWCFEIEDNNILNPITIY